MKLKTVFLVNFLIGSCDALTGLFLVGAPVFTLKMMGVGTLPMDLVFLRYIGVFVFGVGCSYFLPFLFKYENHITSQIIVTWRFTILIRMSVGLFVITAILLHELEKAWILVSITDIGIALLQMFLIRKGILTHD